MQLKKYYRRKIFYENINNPNVYGDFLEVAPKELTLRNKIELKTLFGYSAYSHKEPIENIRNIGHMTPFHEITLVPYSKIEQPEICNFLMEKAIRKPITPRGYAKYMFDGMKDAILDAWNPKKFHILAHSSGYDTRFISVAIRELYEEMGDSWLGNTLFIEADGEHKKVKKLLELEKWKDIPFYVYNNEKDIHDYHSRSLNFTDVHKRFNGIVGFPMNIWYEPIDWLQENGIIPDDDKIQCFTGFGSNEIATSFNLFKGLKWYFEWVYYYPLFKFNTKGECVHPFYNLDLLRNLRIHRKLRFRQGLTKPIIKYIAPQTMDIDTTPIEMRNKTVRLLSKNLIQQAINDYDASWYGQNITPDIRPNSYLMDYSDFWGSWCLASLCEHLIKSGHTLNKPSESERGGIK